MKGGTIKTVTRKGDALVVTLYSESSGVTQDKSRCIWVSAAQVSCPTVNLKTEETTTIIFTDLPASVALREGDALSLRGKQLSRSSSPKAGAGESVDKVAIVFEPAFLDAYQRGGAWIHTPTAGNLGR